MIVEIPFGFEHVQVMKTPSIPVKHTVVKVSATPPDALKSLREYDKIQFEYDGQHSIEFLEDQAGKLPEATPKIANSVYEGTSAP